jgi:uncharacterized protein (TIGR00255 family)
MIKSMTAFAAGDAQFCSLLIGCELRSVNHRYLDVSLKLPEPLRFAESEIRALIAAKLNRGKIDCMISLKKQSDQANLSVNMNAVKALIHTAGEIEGLMPSARPYSALEVLEFPGIQQEADLDREGLLSVIKALISTSLQQMLENRKREGQQLRTIMLERCAKIAALSAQAVQRVPTALEAMRAKITDRITELAAQPDFDRIEQELVILTQKLDVMEELDRMDTHIAEVRRVLDLQEPVGRRLDFLMQELNREANTLGSKSVDKELTQISIEIKVLIEQIREQVQNIE